MKHGLKETYLKTLLERRKKSRVHTSHQEIGLALAQILEDEKHKGLYIKLAKEKDKGKLLELAKGVALRKRIKKRGAYFMRLLSTDKLPVVKQGFKSKKSEKKELSFVPAYEQDQEPDGRISKKSGGAKRQKRKKLDSKKNKK